MAVEKHTSSNTERRSSCNRPHDHDQHDEASIDSSSEPGRERDVEKHNVMNTASENVDPNLVTWNGPDDPENPRNWSGSRKWRITIVTSCFSFISPVSSSMLSPALPAISKDLGITSAIVELLVISIFVLAYAIGPLFFGPLSEIYGRLPILRTSNFVYLVFNTACGFATTTPQMICFRFLGGLAGSAPLAVGGGVLSDVWVNEERGKAMGIYTMMPLLGPAVGPIAAGFIVQYSNWRWCFYSVSIAGCLIQLLGFLHMSETNPRVLLEWKIRELRKKMNNDLLHTEWDVPDQAPRKKLLLALQRPFKLLTTQPIVQFLSLYMAFLYGLMYFILSTFPRLWDTKYHETVGVGGLNYISCGLGFMAGSQTNAFFQDRMYALLTARAGMSGRPEFRIPLMAPAAVIVPIGIFIYAWTSEYVVFWLWPNIGIFMLSAGMIVCFQCMQVYIVQTYTKYAASALAASAVLRCLAGFTFPLFATQMYDSLSYGWGNSVLGFIACGIGWPAVIIFWKYGKALRVKSQFAAGGN